MATVVQPGVVEAVAIDPAGIPSLPPVKEKKPDKLVIPHSVVCDGNTRCDKCRRLGCVGNCVHSEGEHLGLCVVCAGNYKEEDVILHPVPSAKELKDIPALVMPPAKYKKGEKVCIISANEINREFLAQAKALGTDKWAIGNNASNLSIGVILASGLNVDRPRKGHIYLLRMEEYPNREILINEKGISNEKKYVNFKLMHVGQLVRIKSGFPKPIGHDPSYSSEMSKKVGQIFRITQKMTDRRCYTLNDGTGGTYSHDWLEQLRPFLKKDNPVKEKQLKIRDTVKRMAYECWIRQTWRGGVNLTKTRVEPALIDNGYPGKENLIDIELFNELNFIHKDIVNYWGAPNSGATGNIIPPTFILGQRNGVACIALPVFHNFMAPGGCGQMSRINSEEFSTLCADLVAKKYTPCGVARLGTFNINDNSSRGESLSELRKYKDFYILSIGRNGMCLETYSSGKLNYRVINRKEVKPTTEVKPEVVEVTK